MPLALAKLNGLRSISIGYAGVVNTRLPSCGAGFCHASTNNVSTSFLSSYFEMSVRIV